MGRVIIHTNMEADFAAFLALKENKMYALLAAAMVGIMNDARWEMQAITSAADRIDSGDMYNAFGSQVEYTAKKIIGEAGFIGGAQDYYIYQTVTGFRHWLSGERIEPTEALVVAGTKAYAETQAAIEAAIRSV